MTRISGVSHSLCFAVHGCNGWNTDAKTIAYSLKSLHRFTVSRKLSLLHWLQNRLYYAFCNFCILDRVLSYLKKV